MKICVVGLGIIGGSLCMALKRAGYAVAGWNRSQNALDFALENKIIDERAHGFLNYDVVFIALPRSLPTSAGLKNISRTA